MYHDYAYAMEEAMSGMALSLITNAGSSLMSIVIYVFTALSLYSIAKRREISKPWMAWIPVVNCWILGSISDQYRYVAKGETKNKRKTLLILNIISCVVAIAFLVFFFVAIFDMVQSTMLYDMDEEELVIKLLGSLGGMMGMMLPMAGISIAYAIVYYMALYDVYASCDPNNKTVYLVISILFGIAQAILLFICRNKDDGMPPRKGIPGPADPYAQRQPPYQQPPYQAPQYQQPQYQAPQYQQPQYQAPQYQQPQYQAPQYQQPQYQAPQYQQPQYQPPQPVQTTEQLKGPQPDAPYQSPYGDFPDPYAPQHPKKDEPEQL